MMGVGPPQAVLQGQPANHSKVPDAVRVWYLALEQKVRETDQVRVWEMNESEPIDEVSKIVRRYQN